MAEITDQGYVLLTQNQWFEDERGRYLAIDPSWNLDPSVPDGLKLATDSEIWANLDEVGQASYNARDLDRATGIGLDILAKLFFINRQVATPSTAVVSLTGTNGTVIPQGSIVISSVDQSRWLTDNEVTIVPGPGISVGVTAEEPGARSASANTLTEIGTPIGGWTAVDNSNAAIIGTDQESDPVFRRRIKRSRARLGDNQVDSMLAGIGNVTNVTQVEVYENDTNTTDANQIEAHSLAIFVQGGTDEDIAKQIAAYKNPGVGLNRTNTNIGTPIITETTTAANRPFSAVHFRPALIDIFIEVDVQEVGDLPSDIGDQIAAAIIAYITPNLFANDDVTGFNREGFSIGEDVPPGRFYTPVNRTLGIYGDSYATEIRVGTSNSNENTTPVTINFNQLAAFAESNINVTVTPA